MAEDHQMNVRVTGIGLVPPGYCDGYLGRMRTSRVM